MPRHPRPRNTAETLAAVAPLVTRWMERVLASAEPPLSLGQYLGLRAIAAGVDSAADLARATGVSESAVSQLVAGFERAGTVERTPGDDRRRRRLALTADGERLLRTAQKLVGARLEPLVASLAPHDADALAALLRRIEPALAGTAPPRRPPPPHPPGHRHRHPPRP